MATPKKNPVKIQSNLIEVNFVVGFDQNGKYQVVELDGQYTVEDALNNSAVIDWKTYTICRVYLPLPQPQQPLLLTPQ